MKANLIIFSSVFLVFIAELNSQNSFEFIYQDSLNSYCSSTFQDDQGYFVSLGSISNQNYSNIDGLIIKYKDENDIIFQKFHKNDSILYFKFGFLKPNGSYFVAGVVDDDQDNLGKNLYIAEISQDLSINYEKIYSIPDLYNWLSITDLFYDDDSIVIINGMLDDAAPGYTNDIFVAKLNTEGELLNTLINTFYMADAGSEILAKPDHSGYYLVGSFGVASMLKLDNDLNLTGIVPMSVDYSGVLGARWLSDGNIVIGGLANQSVPGAFYDLHMYISDSNLVPLKDTVIFDDGKNWLPLYSGVDFLDENNIWVVTYPQLGKSTTDWEYGRIYIFDSQLNVKGAKYFGGTSSLYLYSIKALNDGGCIITGIASDPESKGFHNVFIKKVMPDDIITNLEETPDPYDFDVLLYPNPFKNKLNVETHRINLDISLFSLDGECIVSKKKLSIPNTIIETSNLKQGTYIYLVSECGKLIQSGKIIKSNKPKI